ncbi:hypothetical protein SBA3_1770001 [Candidatus Sulfopaludibacter sp. SbA3]|nr:hypothetical protein SBA3_1770001 [Candidatus Sulfopaludibacter sp. SbA3]
MPGARRGTVRHVAALLHEYSLENPEPRVRRKSVPIFIPIVARSNLPLREMPTSFRPTFIPPG